MATLTYEHVGEEAIPSLATLNVALLEQHHISVSRDERDLETNLRSYLAEGYQAVVFRWGTRTVGYCLYRLYPKYAFVRHFYVERSAGKKYGPAQAFALLRAHEFTDYAFVRLDVPESAKESLQVWESIGFRPRSVRLELHTARKSGLRKSCGAVIYRIRMGKPLFLVIQHENGGHWGFAKGHVVRGETEQETAKREIAEETGMDVELRDGFYERLYYLTPKERRKEVVYFLSRVRRPRVRLQHSEIRTSRWLPYREARDLLTYENTKLVLDRATQFVADNGP